MRSGTRIKIRRDIVPAQENPGISASASSAVNMLNTEIQDDKKGDDSVNQAAAVLRAGEISSASPAAASLRKKSGLDAFNSLNQSSWQATFSAKTGRVKQLYGAKSKSYGDTPENNAREFLKDTHMLFGIQSDLSDLETHRVNQTAERQHIRFQQTFNGVSVQGAQIIVHSDLKGCVTMVQNDCDAEIKPVNQNLLSLEAARDIARDALSLQLGPKAGLAGSIAENMIIPHKGGYVHIWKITTPTKTPPGLWVYHVDAQSGEILYRADEIFNMTDGRGRAYIDNEEWFPGKTKNVKLEELYETEDGYVEGYLHGPHATIHDYPQWCTAEEADNSSFEEKCRRLDGYNLVYSSKLNFVYDPDNFTGDWEPGDTKPYFDQVQAYYQTTAVWQWWEDNVIKKYGPIDIDYFYWLSIPTVVNIGEWDKDGYSLYCDSYLHPVICL